MVIMGTMNNPGTVIMEVADLATMLLVAQVDEADVGKLALGQKATVHVQAFPDEEFKGVLFLTQPESADNFSFTLLAGQSATIGFTDGSLATVELFDPSQSLVATGVDSGNLSGVISDFTATTSGTTREETAARAE